MAPEKFLVPYEIDLHTFNLKANHERYLHASPLSHQ